METDLKSTMSFSDTVSAAAKKAADATKLAAQKAKLRADMMMIDREVIGRKKAFGVSMYDHVSPLSQSSDFYAATDDLTNYIRPPLITAQKEIQALAAKRVKLKESLAQAEAQRAAAFPTKAETVGQKVVNFGKASVMHGGETKIKAELAMVDRQIKGFKQKFGLDLFDVLSKAEDEQNYLPTDRQVRSIYDQTRGDITRLVAKKKAKGEELAILQGKSPGADNDNMNNNNNNNTSRGAAGVGNDDSKNYGGFGQAQQQQQQQPNITSDLTMQNSYSDSYNAPAPGYSDASNAQMEDLLL